jgi:cysteine desulfurase
VGNARDTVRSDSDRLYLDCAATTPLGDWVLAAMGPLLEDPADEGVWEWVRARLGRCLGADPSRLRFTDSGTAANNLAIRGAADARRGRLVAQPTEHPSVLEPLRALEAAGREVEWLPVSGDGVVDPEDLRRALARGPCALVSIMQANHETGVLQPTAELARLCRAAGVPFHVDAVQGLFKPAHLDLGADLLTLSGHKLHGPKGIGLVALSADAPALPHPPLPAPALGVGFVAAAERRPTAEETSAVEASRNALEARVVEVCPDAVVNGAATPRLAGHLNVSLPRISGEALALCLDQDGIAVSSGAACSSGDSVPSPVLLAMGRTPELAAGSVRLSLPRPLSPGEIERVAIALRDGAHRLRSLAG